MEESFGSNCHLAVVLISDGGTDFPYEQVVKIANNSITRQTRLFTLAVGPHPIPTVNLRNISCSSNASHGAILTFGAIPSKVQVTSSKLLIQIEIDGLNTHLKTRRAIFKFSGDLWHCPRMKI